MSMRLVIASLIAVLACRSCGASEALPTCGRGDGRSRLVLHVGPHKTGTSSLQVFMTSHSEQLQAKLGLKVLAGWDPKAGCAAKVMWCDSPLPVQDTARPGYSQKLRGLPMEMPECAVGHEKIMPELMATMREPGSIGLLSAEALSRCTAAKFAEIRRMGEELGFEVSVVLLHRDEASWYQSQWSELNKRKLCPDPFHLLAPFWDVHNDLLDRVYSAFHPSCVRLTSYDWLREQQMPIEVYVICNATLQLQGEPWQLCDRTVGDTVRQQPHTNIAHPPLLFDVVRLAYAQHQVLQSLNLCGGSAPKLRSPLEIAPGEFSDLMDKLPKRHVAWGNVFRASTERWFNRTNAQRPTAGHTKGIFLVDEAALTQKHMAAIRENVLRC
uniref:Sulfotransferase domain-containing protein n=1 Tax=Zooxanthella nutricula TaxID=1333877 RepID=A0A6U9R651_9DINO|mmetsp:Transcript_85744/g.262372  ORF Transcript_85744/g.262372 Transcript_85744/m.262372 type:complete len:383 (+) Transcript_85744:87-1235(+)